MTTGRAQGDCATSKWFLNTVEPRLWPKTAWLDYAAEKLLIWYKCMQIIIIVLLMRTISRKNLQSVNYTRARALALANWNVKPYCMVIPLLDLVTVGVKLITKNGYCINWRWKASAGTIASISVLPSNEETLLSKHISWNENIWHRNLLMKKTFTNFTAW